MTDKPTPLHQRSLNDYLEILRRRKWIVAESVVLVALVTGLLSLAQPKVFRSTASMLVNQQDLGAVVTGLPSTTATTDPVRSVQTQATLARVPEVARRAVAKAGVPGMTAGELLLQSAVTGSPDSDFLTFVVKNGDPAAAQSLATAYANAFSNYRLERTTQTLERARAELDARARALAAGGDRTSVLYRDLVQKSQQLRTMELLQQRDEVVRDASKGVQVAPTPKRNALLGALVGLVLGLGIIAVWEALDKSVRSEEEIEAYLGLPLLARLPEPPRALRSASRLVMLDDPDGPQAEAVRRLRTNVEFAIVDGDVHSIMVTSAVQREGKSTTIANLAVALARTGRKVVLVDLDLRQPVVHRFFDLEGAVGVTDVVLGHRSLDEALVGITVLQRRPRLASIATGPDSAKRAGTLAVLPAGALPASPGEFVGTTAVAKLLTDLRSRFDVVLVDAPPICVVGDAMTLSARVDALVVIARLGAVDKRTLDELNREIDASPAGTLGVVLTGIDAKDGYGQGYFRVDSGSPVPADNRQRGAAERASTSQR